MMPLSPQMTHDPSTGGRLVAVDARTLPLVHASLSADAGGGIARVVLEQRFRNQHAEPLAVTYSLPLPHDAAVAGFSFRVGERLVTGEIARRAEARERFEQALALGHTAALLEQDRTSLFTQELGNVPPGAEVVAIVTIDQRLAWTDEGSWEWRFPTTVAPRYLGAPGRVPDAARVHQDVADAPMPVRMTFAVNVRDELAGRLPQSPSHALRAEAGRFLQAEEAGVPLDRDVVVRWPVARPEPGARVETGRGPEGDAYALVTLVPPARLAAGRAVPRDLVLLLDVSGSMGGEPLAQLQRVVSALVSTLGERDTLEMIAFASSPRRWRRGAVPVTGDVRADALEWIAGLGASGGTEMRHAIEDALASLRAEAQRQVVVVTDGQIGFESEVVAAILARLPASSRVHVVGVGSAPNRTLTAGASRAGRGVEVLVGLGEDAERAAARIVARTDAPVVVDLTLAGDALVDHAPARLPDLFAGAPALVALRARSGELVVRGRTEHGTWEQRVRVEAPLATARAAVASLYARERVEDLEMQVAAGGEPRTLDAEIERVGLAFGVATRVTSWVAVSEERAVDPNAPTRRVRMPHELPHGMSVEGLGLRAPGAGGMQLARGTVVHAAMAVAAPMPSRAAAPRAQDMRTRAGSIVTPPGTPVPAAPPSAMAPPPPPLGAPPPASGAAAPPPQQPPMPTAAPGKAAGPIARALSALGAAFGGRGGAARRELEGTIAGRVGALVILEAMIPFDVAWLLPERVEVTWDDGTTSDAFVVADHSTSSVAVSAGASVKIALTIAAGRTPVAIAFDHAGERWTVRLA